MSERRELKSALTGIRLKDSSTLELLLFSVWSFLSDVVNVVTLAIRVDGAIVSNKVRGYMSAEGQVARAVVLGDCHCFVWYGPALEKSGSLAHWLLRWLIRKFDSCSCWSEALESEI
jgi:hypothetical protein